MILLLLLRKFNTGYKVNKERETLYACICFVYDIHIYNIYYVLCIYIKYTHIQ